MPGELAVVSTGKLVLVVGGKPGHVVPGAGAATEPEWSSDGKWVAFLRGGSALWVVRADGAGTHQLSPAGADVSEFAWSGQGERLAFSVSGKASYSSKIFLATPTSTKLRELGAYPDLIGFSVAPSGGALAVSYRKGAPPTPGNAPTWKGLLAVVPLAGGPGQAVYTLAKGGYVLPGPGWWPDGKGLLFWDDPAGSASIAADGLALDSLDLATGRVSTLTTTLTYESTSPLYRLTQGATRASAVFHFGAGGFAWWLVASGDTVWLEAQPRPVSGAATIWALRGPGATTSVPNLAVSSS